jgi:hypothetical protein
MNKPFTFLSVLLLLGCGSGDSSTSDGGLDGTIDTSMGGDGSMNKDSPSDTSNMDSVDDMGLVQDTGAEGGDSGIACMSPADCKNMQICCATVVLGNGNFPNCMVNNVSVACANAQSCPTTLPLMCNTTGKFRPCKMTSDCKENQYPKCCTFSYMMTSYQVCANDQIAQALGGSCM